MIYHSPIYDTDIIAQTTRHVGSSRTSDVYTIVQASDVYVIIRCNRANHGVPDGFRAMATPPWKRHPATRMTTIHNNYNYNNSNNT